MRKLQGIIVSDAMTKTRVITVTQWKKHPRYLKYYKIIKRFKAHDEKNEYHKGDQVVIQETRPISKEKRWVIIEKVENSNISAEGGSASGGKITMQNDSSKIQI